MSSTKQPPHDSQTHADPTTLSFEQAMDQLQALVDQMESGSTGLAQSLDSYKRGTALVKHCRGLLAAAESEIERIGDEGR